MRQTRLLFLGLLPVFGLLSCGDDTPTPIDESGTATDEIVGGATFRGLPAVGALTYGGQFYCTGTLIGPRQVVTAAHCVHSFSPVSRLHFVIGTEVTRPEAVLDVVATAAHPGYRPDRLADDIGLVTLADDAPVAPMPVLARLAPSLVGTPLLFVGYGVNDGLSHTGAGTKRATWIKVTKLDPRTFAYSDPVRNTCNGDSGGPAFARQADGSYALAGITSYGDTTCTVYGVDTRTDAYLDFLHLLPPPSELDG